MIRAYAHVYVCIYMCLCVCVCALVRACVCVCVCTNTHVFVHMRMVHHYVFVHMCMVHHCVGHTQPSCSLSWIHEYLGSCLCSCVGGGGGGGGGIFAHTSCGVWTCTSRAQKRVHFREEDGKKSLHCISWSAAAAGVVYAHRSSMDTNDFLAPDQPQLILQTTGEWHVHEIWLLTWLSCMLWFRCESHRTISSF